MGWWQRVLLGLLLLAHWTLTWQMAVLATDYGPNNELRIVMSYGVLLGQSVLASLWLACLRDSRWWRGLCVLLLAAWAWLAMALGITMPESLAIVDVLLMGSPIVMSLLGASGVLSVAWWIFRWEIRSPGDDGSSSRQFSLRRSLAMMAMACIFLAIARNFMPPADQSDGTEFTMLPAALLLFLVGTALTSVVFAVNCCAMLPMIAAIFKIQEHWLPWTLVLLFFGVPGYGLVVAIIEGAIVAWLGGGDSDNIWILMASNMAQLSIIVLTLAFLRMIGFRFERSPRRAKVPPDGGGERLQDAGPGSTMAAASESSPLAIDR